MYCNRGMGADAPDCQHFLTWPPNIFNPECYAILWQKNFGTADQKKAVAALQNPDLAYGTLVSPTTPGAPTQDQLNAAYPDQLSAILVAQAGTDTQASVQNYMNQTAAGLDDLGKTPTSSGLSTLAWAAIAAAGIGAVVLVSRGRR